MSSRFKLKIKVKIKKPEKLYQIEANIWLYCRQVSWTFSSGSEGLIWIVGVISSSGNLRATHMSLQLPS